MGKYRVNYSVNPPYLLDCVLVSLVRGLEVRDQVPQRAVRQRLVHQVLAAAHAQRAIATVTVDAQHHVVEAVARELGLKTDGEALERREPVGQVTVYRVKEEEALKKTHLHLQKTKPTPMTGALKEMCGF